MKILSYDIYDIYHITHNSFINTFNNTGTSMMNYKRIISHHLLVEFGLLNLILQDDIET